MRTLPGHVRRFRTARHTLLGLALLAGASTALSAQQAKRSTRRAAAGPDTTALIAGCTGGKSASCLSMAYLLMAGKPLPADTARAVGLMEQACRAGSARSCGQTAWMLRQGLGVRADTGRAFAIFGTGCSTGDAKSCTSLGYMYEVGAGITRDKAQAASYYDRGCTAGDSRGCANLGMLLDSGMTVATDAARSTALLLLLQCVSQRANFVVEGPEDGSYVERAKD